MASYERLLAEDIQEIAANHEDKCYHQLDGEQRVQAFHEGVREFLRKWDMELCAKEKA